MPPMIIAFHGKAGSGKDTAAQYIISRFGEDLVRQFAFADPLKRVVMRTHGLSEKEVYDPVLKEIMTKGTPVTPRHLLQSVGTIMREEIGPNVFVDAVSTKIASTKKPIVVVSDLRYPNEAEFVRGQGGLVVHLNRPDHSGTTLTSHSSEQPLPAELVDLFIENDKDLATFFDRLETALSKSIENKLAVTWKE